MATLEGTNNARLPLPRWFLVGRKGTLEADGNWGRWTEMRVRGDQAEKQVDLLPGKTGPGSGSRNYDAGKELSSCFYGDLAASLGAGRTPAISAGRARDVMAILEVAWAAHAGRATVRI